MADSPTQKEIEDGLKDCANSLINIPHSTEELITLLDELESLLIRVAQAPADSIKDALLPVMEAVVRSELLKHTDADVIVSVVSCIYEISRISAPQQPYDDELMKEIFQLTVRTFEELSHSGRRYQKAVNVLETVAEVKACLIMLDLDCHALVVEIIRMFLRIIRADHPDIVFTSMEIIMVLLIEESDEINMELLQPLLDSLRKENQILSPISSKLGEKVLKKCASTVRPCLLKALKSRSMDLNDHAEIIASICNETPKGEQMENENVTTEKVGPSAAVICETLLEDGPPSNNNGTSSKTLQPCSQMEQPKNIGVSNCKVKSGSKRKPRQSSRKRGSVPEGDVDTTSGLNIVKREENLTHAEESSVQQIDEQKQKKEILDIEESGNEETKPSIGDGNLSGQLSKTKLRRKLTARKNQDFKRRQFTKKYGEEIVGTRIRVWWPLDKMFYEGAVSGFDHVNKRHQIAYDDGETEILNLNKEQFEFLEDNPSDKKHEADLQCNAVSSVPSKSNPQKCDFGSMDIPIPDKMNAEVGCETSSGKKELVDKEDKDTTQNQRLETSKIALESSLTLEDHPSDEKHETDLQSHDVSAILSMKKKAKGTSLIKKEPGVSSSKRSKRNPQKGDIGSMGIPIPDKMNDADDVGCETSSGKKELVQKEDNDITQKGRSKTSKVSVESSSAFGVHSSDKTHELDLQSNDASSVPSKKKRIRRTPLTKKEPGVSSSKRSKTKPKKSCVESLDIPILGKMNDAADVGCETSRGIKELVDKEQVAFESSVAIEIQPSDKNHETGPQSNDASSVPSMKKRTKRTPSTKKEPGVSSSKRAKGKPKRICVESLDIPTLGKMNAAADVGCETSSGVKELVDKEQVAFESSLGLESQPSDKNHETGPQSNDASSVPSMKKRTKRTPSTKKEPGVSSSKRAKGKPKRICVESLDIPTLGKMNAAADVGCETSSGVKELVDKEQVAFESSLGLEIQPSDKNHETGPQSNDASSVPSMKKRTKRTPSTKKEPGVSSSKRAKGKPKRICVESLDIPTLGKMNAAADVGCETSSGVKELVDKEQVAFESSLGLESQPSDKNPETGPQSNDASSVPSKKKRIRRTPLTKKEPGVSSSKRSKTKPKESCVESLDTPTLGRLNDAADVGCETSSGVKELVDKEQVAFESSLGLESQPSDKNHETGPQSNDASSVPSMKKRTKRTPSTKKEPGVSSSKRAKGKPKRICVESLDIPTLGKMNAAADVGCETSSGVKELVDKEQVAFESSLGLESQPSDKNHETGPQSNDASSVPSMKKRTKRTPSTKKEPGVSSSKRAKGKPKRICVESLDIPTLGKMNAAADVGCETSSGVKELVDKEQVAFESSLAFEIQPSDKNHDTGPQSNDASSVPSMKKRTKRTPSTKKEPGVSSSKRAKGKPKRICVESLDIPTLGKMNAAADVGCETSSGVKELVDKEQVAFESSLGLESQPSDKNPETGPQSNDASSVPSKKKRIRRTPLTKKEPGVSSSKRSKTKPKESCVESLDTPTLGRLNDAADVGCETSSGVKELVDKEQVAFESSLGLESQPSDKNPETGPQSNDASSVPSKKKRIRRTPLTKKEPGVSSSKRSKTKPKESCVESLDTPTLGRLNDAADVGCETSSGIKELVDKEQVAFESSLAFEIQPSDKNHDTGPQSNDVPSSQPKKKRTRRTPSTKKEHGASSSKRFKSKTQKSDGKSLDIPIPDKMEDASDVGGETITEKKQLVDNEDDMLAQAESKH
ncbi:uncharacterized protein LOC107012099 isoform X3 [Solanum pennellii]|uniref:Uncharacterized protein LOC107012099 isoform X3 n=1 Tax=Solanum pennellii TaxID=28526 RepID=A0ABM1V7F0_SOLPN|nr:uncharacterized protein LOC107012099 isoform X3 [Solanum pennellii]